ncbi:hypothetical protein DUI87_32140 [Hirundo rustica rustica]|uniref:Endonuclease/exonuclease/phosphatase domain-containing protein n=1 Tax=Hirundo rustica rustica TaxID=333673 RepID=A0A3M0IXY5_HIRRU|nr:hypothetical protein DUI87_32140 [Hirundo rustica rustica]
MELKLRKVELKLRKMELKLKEDGTETKEGGIETKEDGIETKEDGIETKDGGIEAKEGGIETEEDGIETKEGGIEAKEGGIETEEDGIETKDGGVEAKEGGVETKEGGVEAKEGGVEAKEGGVEAKEGGVECLWVRRKGKANKADILLGVCYRPPSQEEEVDNLFYKQLGNVSGSSALVLTGDFNLPDICWELHTAEKRQSREFSECMEDNFLSQLVGEPSRGGTMLDLLFVNRDGLAGDVVVGGCLGQSDREIIEFSIFGEVRRSTSKTLALDFGLLGDLFRTSPGKQPLKTKEFRNAGHASKQRSRGHSVMV